MERPDRLAVRRARGTPGIKTEPRARTSGAAKRRARGRRQIMFIARKRITARRRGIWRVFSEGRPSGLALDELALAITSMINASCTSKIRASSPWSKTGSSVSSGQLATRPGATSSACSGAGSVSPRRHELPSRRAPRQGSDDFHGPEAAGAGVGQIFCRAHSPTTIFRSQAVAQFRAKIARVNDGGGVTTEMQIASTEGLPTSSTSSPAASFAEAFCTSRPVVAGCASIAPASSSGSARGSE